MQPAVLRQATPTGPMATLHWMSLLDIVEDPIKGAFRMPKNERGQPSLPDIGILEMLAAAVSREEHVETGMHVQVRVDFNLVSLEDHIRGTCKGVCSIMRSTGICRVRPGY